MNVLSICLCCGETPSICLSHGSDPGGAPSSRSSHGSAPGDILGLDNNTLWLILCDIEHTIGANVCRRFRDLYRARYVIKNILPPDVLHEASQFYQLSPDLIVQCMHYGFRDYIINTHHRWIYNYDIISTSIMFGYDLVSFFLPKINKDIYDFIRIASSHENIPVFDLLSGLSHGSDPENIRLSLNNYQNNANLRAAMVACGMTGNMYILKKLIDMGTGGRCHITTGYVGARDETLVIACENNQLPVVQYLLGESGDDSGIFDFDVLYRGFIGACKNNNIDIVVLLLNIDISLAAADDNNPIIVAAQNGAREVVEYLCDPSFPNNDRCDPSAQNGAAILGTITGDHWDIATFLLRSGAGPVPDTGVDYVCRSGQLRILQMIMNSQSIDLDQSFYEACKSGNYKMVTFLLDAGANMGFQSPGPLMEAVKSGNLQLVQLLRSHAPDHKIVRAACGSGHIHIMEFILSSVTDLHAGYNGAFFAACENGDMDLIKFLGKLSSSHNSGFNPGAKDNLALEIACNKPEATLAKYLLTLPEVSPELHKKKLLILACRTGDVELLNLLLNKGVDPGFEENTALITAITYRNYNMVARLLSDFRVDPGAQNNAAIVRAVERGNKKIVKLLLAHPGVDPRKSPVEITKSGDRVNRAYSRAIECKYFRIAELVK